MAEWEPDSYALPAELEAERLLSLRKLHVLHTPPDERFAAITRMARVACDVPMAAINLMDRDQQLCIQFSADSEVDFNVPREQSVCQATLARTYSDPDDLALIYEDLADSEFADLPAVNAGGGIRFYAGFPLFGPGGHAIGTFCVFDTRPRRLTAQERATFDELAAWTQREIQNTDQIHALESTQTLLRASADSVLDPHVLLEGVHDDDGRVVDFRFVSVNKATCSYLGLPEADLIGRRPYEDNPNLADEELKQLYVQCLEDGQPVILESHAMFNEILDDRRRYDIQATRAGHNLLSVTWRDVTERFHAAQQLAASELQYRLIAENSSDVVFHTRDRTFVWISPSVETVLGAPPAYWLGRGLEEIVPPDDLALHASRIQELDADGFVQGRVRVKAVDGTIHWAHLHARPFFDSQGRRDGVTSSFRLIDDEVAAEEQAEEARRQQAIADARYRRSVSTSAIGICMLAPSGAFLEVNPALCDMLGYDAETLLSKTWQELTQPGDLAVGEKERQEVFAGLRDSYRIVKQYLHADGHTIWADVAVSCVRDENGAVEAFATQIADITDEVQSRRRLAESEQQNRLLAERLQSEMNSAIQYVESILPGDLSGQVALTSRYMPSQELGGDGFHYRWIDDEHLKIYMVDVSGHGIQPALLSTSVYNLIRSGTLPNDVLLSPVEVVKQLNDSFKMADQGDHYFTVWYGIYEASTRMLRYACAGPSRCPVRPGWRWRLGVQQTLQSIGTGRDVRRHGLHGGRLFRARR